MLCLLIKLTPGDGENEVVQDPKNADMITVSKERCTDQKAFADHVAKYGFTMGISETTKKLSWRAFKPKLVELA